MKDLYVMLAEKGHKMIYIKPEAVALHMGIVAMQSISKYGLSDKKNILENDNTQNPSNNAPETGGDQVVDPEETLEGAKRWGWYTGEDEPF